MPEALPTLGPQAALEQACVQLLREQLKLDDYQCARQFDGKPPPASGDLFYSLWSKGARRSLSRESLDERFGVSLTITLRMRRPRDRWLVDRDEMERLMNEARALLHGDTLDQRVINRAGELAGRSQDDTRHVNFCEPLVFSSLDAIVVVGNEWFASGRGENAGLAQTAHFVNARLIQAIATAV